MSIATPYRLKSKQAFPLTGRVRADLPYARGRRRYRSYMAMNIHMTQRSVAAGRLLTGRVSLVTGSTSGIGLAVAEALAGAGSHVVLNGFGKPEEIAAIQKRIAADHDVHVSYSEADMSKADAIADMVETVLGSYNRLDVLVNNAGIQHVAPLQDFPPDKWDAILAINLSSAFHTTRLALPGMLERQWGRIVNIASAHGLVG